MPWVLSWVAVGPTGLIRRGRGIPGPHGAHQNDSVDIGHPWRLQFIGSFLRSDQSFANLETESLHCFSGSLARSRASLSVAREGESKSGGIARCICYSLFEWWCLISEFCLLHHIAITPF
ncbi:hypothetical protein J5N97_008510 [Dioscorea zingiberensis]|uniref:Uncharacterized protein n=1 Tax=Dioscorea zingiberensis TaxID=325984 RepID=A0A9D5CUV7_9LILI|nr:hypothetical protein J5N97_008510 [Dioscorea zingiberensis]